MSTKQASTKPYPYETATPEQQEIGSWWWCIHHGELIEQLTEPIESRARFIRKSKPPEEWACRLRNMAPVLQPELLPASYRRARKILTEAWKAYNEAWRTTFKGGSENWKACDEAREVYNEAWGAHDVTWKACRKKLVARHDAEYPDNTWNGTSIFGV